MRTSQGQVEISNQNHPQQLFGLEMAYNGHCQPPTVDFEEIFENGTAIES